MATYFDFQNINLIPKKCIVQSRSEINTCIQFGKYNFALPIVPANMECVLNEEIAIRLAKHNYFYIYHRFDTNILDFSKKMKQEGLPISISVGVNEDAYTLLTTLDANNCLPDFLTIDIAHGHSVKLHALVQWIRTTLRQQPYIIAGNVSTGEAVRDLESWGVDAIKVGIGPGSACTTYVATGFGSRGAQASIVQQCALARQNPTTKIIADGGIKDPGDIAKALVLGADMVMIGGMFSGLTDSPGKVIRDDQGRMYKEFWGSASAYQSGKMNRIEGIKRLIPLKDRSILEEMVYLKECLQSAVSYGGGSTIRDLFQVQYFLLHSRV
jgi:GMP reductase